MSGAPVRRRRVLYLPGFDPVPPRRYRELYRREGTAQAAIAGYALGFGPRRDRTGFGWGVTFDDAVHTEVEVLVWSDVVAASMGHGLAATYAQLVRTAWTYIASGTLSDLMRLRRGPVLAALYPIAVLLAQAGLALAVWALAGGLLGWPGWLLGAGFAWGVLAAFRRADGRLFAHYLMHDYAFTAQTGGAWPARLEPRLDAFAARVTEVLAGDWDEVLVVGHSSGACLAVSVLARVDLPEARPAVGLLTLGHVVPMIAFLPRATRLRADLARISAERRLTWVDVTAPGDACSFALCDPVAVTGVGPPDAHQPLVLSAAFSQTLSPERMGAMRHRWFRRHFQYLCAFDRPQGYDYFAITAGPLTLAQRFVGRAPSPGRITRPANRHRSLA